MLPRVMKLVSAAVLAASLVLTAAPDARAQSRDGFGLGVMLGEINGLSAKYWLNKKNALQFGLSFDLRDDGFNFLVDYLWHWDVIRLRTSAFELPLYVGIGGKLTEWGHRRWRDRDGSVALGIRVPLGISMNLREAPLDFFLEVVPGVRLIPSTDGDIDAALGARFYF